ncbi:sugar porter family MFS transporter [Pseudomaricurvus alcaniphilus]|uniref:sugar porter family MFS transporter n=1 Tax=Pseudomaricurvus alcaniphilus TaxID=1166482 RepID=UPI001A9E8026|nr:sugar porter family MFS transporter [Pseudomaricurvus alcaniphilus]
MNNIRQIIFWSVTVAVAGFLFGFDTAVISGADQPLQKLWQTSDLFHGALVMSAALWGTVIGALTGNIPCERYGRKLTLIAIGVLYLISALGSALAQDPYTFSIMRFIGGVGVGLSSIAVPAYISEIAPANHRGRLVALYQFQIVFGILVAFLSNYLLTEIGGLGWRWMLGLEAIPAFVFLALIVRVPESPRWLLIRKNDETEARRIIQIVNPDSVERTVKEIRHAQREFTQDSIFNKAYSFPIMLAFLVAFFNQVSGINFIIYYAPRVFESAGLDASSALLSSAGIGMVNLVFTMLGLYLIDMFGRKQLLLVGSIGYIVSLSAVAWAFASGAGGATVVFFVFLFIAAHAVGQGAVIWVFIAEIFPNNVRTQGQSIGSGTHWVFAALITLLMPFVLGRFEPATIFAFFAFMMALQLLWVVFIMPETKGRTLESLAEGLSQHAHPSLDEELGSSKS